MGPFEFVVALVAIVLGATVGIVWAGVSYASKKRELADGGSEELASLRGDVGRLTEEVSRMHEAIADMTLMLADSSTDGPPRTSR